MPTNRDRIEKWSLAYHLLKYYVDFCFRFYFRTTVSGLGNIPKDKSLIFAPNHQNALIDALAILSVKNWQPVFLARADIFEKPLINKILTFLKILPVYRIRDGYSNLHKNDNTFQKTMDVVNNKNGLVILPEGNHGDQKRLRPLKKGIARIAFQALEAQENLDLYVVPVGIDYRGYISVLSKLHIRFGVPIAIKPMLKIYKKNPAQAYIFLLEQLAAGIKSEIIHIEEQRYYTASQVMIESFTSEYLSNLNLPNTHPNIIDAQIKLLKQIDLFKANNHDDFLLLAADALEYNLLLKRRNLKLELFMLTPWQKISLFPILLSLLITLPFFFYSLVNNIVPLGIARYVSNKFKDKQFISSVRFAVGIIAFPIIHLIQLVVFILIFKNYLLALAYAISLPLSLLIFFVWKRNAINLWFKIKEMWINLFSRKKIQRLKELNKEIKKQMWIIANYKEDEDYMSSN